jgi:mannose-6-phosphate isomerase-like protein (cupin superfamily)
MVTIIDLKAGLAKLTMLRERTPEMTSADREGSAAQLAPYGGSNIFTSKFAGKGAWERHPDGDELVQIVDGAATLDIASADGPPQSFAVSAGIIAIVPKGAWHRFHSPGGVTMMTVTPQPSEHLGADVDDPRTF